MNLLASTLRTLVPLLAGWVLTVTGALGIDADSTAVAGGVTIAVTAAYYLALRLAEEAAARLEWEPLRLAAGVLLGWARPPQYEPTLTTAPVRVRFDTEALATDVGEALRQAARDAGGSTT